MILIIEFIVLSVVYISMAVIMKYNNISLKTKSYWFMMALAVFLYMFGFVIGKYYTVWQKPQTDKSNLGGKQNATEKAR